MKKISIFYLFLFASGFCFISRRTNAQIEQLERLPIHVKATVEWDEIVKNDDGKPLQKTVGKYEILVEGFMKLNDKSSPAVSKGGITVMPFETYQSDILTISMKYKEEWHDLKEYRSCTNTLVKQYKGETSQKVNIGPTLIICDFASAMKPYLQNLSEEQKKYIMNSGQGNVMPGYYQIAIGGGDLMNTVPPQEITVRGVKIKPDCSYEEVEKRFPGFTIGLQMSLPGEMNGKKSWQADAAGAYPPSFGIKISDMGVHGGEQPYNPPRATNGNVTYVLEWEIGK